jgi:hypothetical protein
MLSHCRRALALLAVPLVLALVSVTPADATSSSDLRDVYGRPNFEKVRTFGNKKRIARRIDASSPIEQGKAVYVKDEVSGRPDIVALSRVGNRHRIEARVDPTPLLEKGDVVYLTDPEGSRRMVGYSRFGNRRRIEKLTGAACR